jgi:ubiquilin
MVEMTVNPKYQKEILKNHDRALNNLESLPEGFNALKKLYSNLQEPMYKAVESANETQVHNTIDSSRIK